MKSQRKNFQKEEEQMQRSRCDNELGKCDHQEQIDGKNQWMSRWIDKGYEQSMNLESQNIISSSSFSSSKHCHHPIK